MSEQLIEWAERTGEEVSALVPAESKAVVSLSIAGAPGGDVDVTWTADGGAVITEPVVRKDADVVVTAKYKDFVAMANGDLPLPVAYMQGRLKPSGDNGLILRMLAASATPEAEAVRERVAADI